MITSSFGIIVTVIIYFLTVKLHKKVNNPLTLPILVATGCIIALLLLTDISYKTYYSSAKWIEHLLGPAVVALAFPLYKQFKRLKSYFVPITIGIFIGAIVGVGSGVLMAKLLGFDEQLIASVAPKSITTPVAMEVAQSLGGIPPIAALFVMVAGIGGAVLCTVLSKISGIHHHIAKGVSIGTASHAIGTAKAMEDHPQEGAASTLAMSISAMLVAGLLPLLQILLAN
ncbi:LrgB family protein [Halalkalibacterium halodurans]|jgi:predicted murein hydrolase (TIGR00659 family)|uniref:TIGR00659 family protein n=1 Tax=Halalkalibacterium halodurans TaxID=86665 RepID=A0A0M0KGQ1_ALKHA|nr:LrgB family protein [Halalkalibacterium halodurans]MED3645976.1 LrgB family protein [Halalkalibacterium halodurans]MED4164153.1 LrgB family protein [Halalkalibacterium halodurans]TES54376.1 LrgB family protein [Halalkalibacterium halodurans]TPE67219.1 LrgB family protein [Halalkalibacterium halodurans]